MASRSQEHADCNFHNFKLSSIFISSVFTPMILPVFRFLSLNNPYLQCSKKTVTSSPGGTSFSDIKQGGGSRELSTESDLHTSIFLLICKSLRFTIIRESYQGYIGELRSWKLLAGVNVSNKLVVV